MASLHDKSTFASAYADKAPWDIGKAQPQLAALADQVQGSILDAGCGTGENSLYYASLGHKVTGIDYLDVPIQRARQKAAERGLAANFLVMDALALDQLPEQFDCVIDSGLFHVFSDADRRQYVSGLASVVKPGGKVFLMCFSDAEPGTTGPRRISRAELEASFADGWKIESLEPTHFEIRDEFKEVFSPGGPKAWLATIKRT